MPAKTPGRGGLGSKAINPVPVIVIALVILAALGYTMFIRPAQQAEAIAKNWATPEEAAKRSPEGRPKDQAYEDKVKELLAKEGHGARGGSRRER
jgi:hypothetical protein